MRRARDNGGWTKKRIKELRQRFKWTRKKFAQVMSVSEMTVYRWEEGSVPIKAAQERLGKLANFELNGVAI